MKWKGAVVGEMQPFTLKLAYGVF